MALYIKNEICTSVRSGGLLLLWYEAVFLPMRVSPSRGDKTIVSKEYATITPRSIIGIGGLTDI